MSGNGITIEDGSVNNRISDNRIFENDGIGIDLNSDGITENDSDNSDTGASNLQNYPVIASAEFDSKTDQLTILYSIHSDPVHSSYPLQVEFYKHTSNRQGLEFVGSDSYMNSDFGIVKEVTITIMTSVFN